MKKHGKLASIEKGQREGSEKDLLDKDRTTEKSKALKSLHSVLARQDVPITPGLLWDALRSNMGPAVIARGSTRASPLSSINKPKSRIWVLTVLTPCVFFFYFCVQQEVRETDYRDAGAKHIIIAAKQNKSLAVLELEEVGMTGASAEDTVRAAAREQQLEGTGHSMRLA